MSNVQLSSSALERLVARRTFPLHRRTSVCRNLFGPVDHDELNRDMKARMLEISERDQQRWNFNFEANTPLDGDYEWEAVPVVKTAEFYMDSVQKDRSRVPATPVKTQTPSSEPAPPSPPPPALETPLMDVLERLVVPDSSSDGSSDSSSGGSSSAPCQVKVNQENRTDKLNSGKTNHRHVPCVRRKRTPSADNNNTHITDFFVKRKRADRKADTSGCHLSKSPIPVEQTPRKRIR